MLYNTTLSDAPYQQSVHFINVCVCVTGCYVVVIMHHNNLYYIDYKSHIVIHCFRNNSLQVFFCFTILFPQGLHKTVRYHHTHRYNNLRPVSGIKSDKENQTWQTSSACQREFVTGSKVTLSLVETLNAAVNMWRVGGAVGSDLLYQLWLCDHLQRMPPVEDHHMERMRGDGAECFGFFVVLCLL